MTGFRVLLAVLFAVLLGYTLVVMGRHGSDLFTPFFGDIVRIGWPGQFNLDFSFMLLLSGLWVAWRHRFAPGGIALGVAAAFGGALFLSAYLLMTSFRSGGDIRKLLLGESRA